jgi:hypothetical protein
MVKQKRPSPTNPCLKNKYVNEHFDVLKNTTDFVFMKEISDMFSMLIRNGWCVSGHIFLWLFFGHRTESSNAQFNFNNTTLYYASSYPE